MNAQITIETDLKSMAQATLMRIRQNCYDWAVDADIDELRQYLGRGAISLADIGTSEEELETCFKTGHKTSALSWLRVAKEECKFRDVSFEIACVNNRLSEANLAMKDIGSSEGELQRILSAHNKRQRA